MGMVDSVAFSVLDNRFGAAAAAPTPANYYVALSSTTPTNAGGNFTEPVGNGYARELIANNKTTFTAAAVGGFGRQVSNAIAISFPPASGGNWGTMTHFGLYDAPTGGNLLDWGPLTPAVTINDGVQWDFPENQMILALTMVP